MTVKRSKYLQRFRDELLEKEFCNTHEKKNIPFIRWGYILAFVGWTNISILTYSLAFEDFIVLSKYFFLTLLYIGIVVFLTYKSDFSKYSRWIVSPGILLVSFLIIHVISSIHGEGFNETSKAYLIFSSLVFQAFFAFFIVRLRFVFASTISLIFIAVFQIIIIQNTGIEVLHKMIISNFLWLFDAMLIFGGYFAEVTNRKLFIQEKEIKKFSDSLERELLKGRKIQKEFIPDKIPLIDGCDIRAFFKPAMQLSGDFYDFFRLPNNRIGIVLADVSDKGVGAALFMALIRSLVRIFSGHFDYCNSGKIQQAKTKVSEKDSTNIINTVSQINNFLSTEHGNEGMFATLFFGIFSPTTGNLVYTNCGHEPLMLINKEGLKTSLRPLGPALGIDSGLKYRSGEIKLEKGDLLFGFTDGVTEARSPVGELYSRSRLEKLIRKIPLDSPEKFLSAITGDLFEYVGEAPQTDDITIFAIQKN